ncbi:universal stress protein [Sulfitobacter sp. MF3-043]|uniref:universal stress protein n=1 Tax=Sulfitobacter sediminivivens TaxID=3252902 RepID=UPI0036D81F40
MTRSKQAMPPGKDRPSKPEKAFETSDVLVFLEDASVTSASVSHAQKIASAFGGQVVLVQVLCKPVNGNGPIDPVEWDIKKQKTLKQLGFLTKETEIANHPCRAELLEGQCVNQIKAFMEHRQGDIAASLRPRSDTDWHLSETAWGVLSSQSAAVLIIPDDALIERNAQYRRILLPLDGSSRAEAALPVAMKLARAEHAELIICNVLPASSLTELAAGAPKDERLLSLVRQRNEQAGKTYLARIRKRLERNGLRALVRISHGSDVRRALIDIMSKEYADFVVMATHGQSGHKDVPTGDVARYVLDNAQIPVLLVRPRNNPDSNHAFGKVSSTGVRQPAGTD